MKGLAVLPPLGIKRGAMEGQPRQTIPQAQRGLCRFLPGWDTIARTGERGNAKIVGTVYPSLLRKRVIINGTKPMRS